MTTKEPGCDPTNNVPYSVCHWHGRYYEPCPECEEEARREDHERGKQEERRLGHR